MDIEALWPTDYLAIRERLGFVKSEGEVSLSSEKVSNCGPHVEKPALSAVMVSMVAAIPSFWWRWRCRPRDQKSSIVLRRLVANLRAHRLASSAVAQARPVRVVLLPKKIPGVGCRRQAVKRWQLAGVWAEESTRRERKEAYMCEGEASARSFGR